MRRFHLWFIAGLLVACNTRGHSDSSEAPSAPSPVALDLHAQLFAAADAGDVAAFKALLSPRSIALLADHLKGIGQLDLPPNTRGLGWRDLLEMHSELPLEARKRAPYPVVNAKLDIAGHSDAAFFRAVRMSIKEVKGE